MKSTLPSPALHLNEFGRQLSLKAQSSRDANAPHQPGGLPLLIKPEPIYPLHSEALGQRSRYPRRHHTWTVTRRPVIPLLGHGRSEQVIFQKFHSLSE